MSAPSTGQVFEFEFAFEDSYRRGSRLFGITPASTRVTVTDDRLQARFGPWLVATDLANIASVELTGPYRRVKTIGPARLSVLSHSLTFATNHRRGVEIRFHETVGGIEPTGRVRHPNLTVTVADWAALATLLDERVRG